MRPKHCPVHNRARAAPIRFDKQACLQILSFAFEYSLQSLTLPSVCLTITENNALATIVLVTHKCPKFACFGAETMRSPPFRMQLARLCASRYSVGCRSARSCGRSPVIWLSTGETTYRINLNFTDIIHLVRPIHDTVNGPCSSLNMRVLT